MIITRVMMVLAIQHWLAAGLLVVVMMMMMTIGWSWLTMDMHGPHHTFIEATE